jgi:peptidoglycan-associated lipoprotein
MGLLQDVHFDFDRADIREEDRPLLNRNAETLRRFDFLEVSVEGHCDERGTVEYNLALGERRAQVTYDYLVSLGVARERLRTASYGKEAPLCSEPSESCWARNRRAKPRVTGSLSRSTGGPALEDVRVPR